jgi:hypothetical protein
VTNRELVNLLRGLAAFLIALPGTLALVPDLALSPTANALLLVAAMAGATLMSQLPPLGKAGEPDPSQLDGLIEDVEKLTPEERREMAGRLELRAEQKRAKRARVGPQEGA